MQFYNTSVSARCRVPYAVEENCRGMTERKTERQKEWKKKWKKDKDSDFLLLDFFEGREETPEVRG